MTLTPEEPEEEESHIDRRKKYNALIAGGMNDKTATEKVWPKTTAGRLQNVKEKAEKDAKEAEAKEAGKQNKDAGKQKKEE